MASESPRCPKCGKSVGSQKKGSITGWLFAESVCTCKQHASKVVSEPGARGTIDDKYEILSELGRGGFGTVYQVRELRTQRLFALKMLKPELKDDSRSNRRFEAEGLAAARLDHPNLVGVHEVSRTQLGEPYIVMAFIRGRSLADVLRDDLCLKPSRAIDVFLQVSDALAYAHDHGVVHRDLKPRNIILEDGDSHDALLVDIVKVVDFGIAKVIAPGNGDATQLTQTGEICGSPLYMSPEQCVGKPVDARSDIYSLGCVMYEALTGVNPFAGENPVQTILKHINQAPPPFKAASPFLKIPPQLEAIVMIALAKNPDQRYASMHDVSRDLLLLQSSKDPLEPRTKNAASRSGSGLLQGNRLALIILAVNTLLAASLLAGHNLGMFDSRAETKPAPRAAALVPPPVSVPEGARSSQAVSSPEETAYPEGVAQIASLPKDLTTRQESTLDRALIMARRIRASRTTADGKERVAYTTVTNDRNEPIQVPVSTMNEYQAALDARYARDFADAERGFRQCIAKEPNFDWPYSALGNMYIDMNRFDEADELLQKALKLNPASVVALRNLSALKYKQKDYAAEVVCLKRILAIERNDEESLRHLKFLKEHHLIGQ
jgi:tetratricopeptide (TPR) repeat protein/tRNA A-37 threonylcarbamoyl transferase component Bud32